MCGGEKNMCSGKNGEVVKQKVWAWVCHAENMGVVSGYRDKMGVVGRERRDKNMCGRTKKNMV